MCQPDNIPSFLFFFFTTIFLLLVLILIRTPFHEIVFSWTTKYFTNAQILYLPWLSPEMWEPLGDKRLVKCCHGTLALVCSNSVKGPILLNLLVQTARPDKHHHPRQRGIPSEHNEPIGAVAPLMRMAADRTRGLHGDDGMPCVLLIYVCL